MPNMQRRHSPCPNMPFLGAEHQILNVVTEDEGKINVGPHAITNN
jgi:hypothetical protein